jgi:hypothetical protein
LTSSFWICLDGRHSCCLHTDLAFVSIFLSFLFLISKKSLMFAWVQDADQDNNGLIDKYELGKLLTKLAPLEHPIDDLDAIFGECI